MITKMTTEEFIFRSKIIWADKYNYSKAKYKHYKQKLLIDCPYHGFFKQTPFGHLQGKEGCKTCVKLKQVELGLRLPLL